MKSLHTSGSFTKSDIVCDIDVIKISDDSILNIPEGLKQNLSCPICLSVVWKPLTCGECDKPFCTKCIEDHLSHNIKCPYCMQAFKKRTNRMLNDLLEIMEIACPLKCTEKTSYNGLTKHLSICEKQIKKFKCGECKTIINAYGLDDSVIKEHRDACQNSFLNCIFCDIPTQRRYLANHMDNCSKRLLKCDSCNTTYPADFKQAHNGYYCSKARLLTKREELIEKL